MNSLPIFLVIITLLFSPYLIAQPIVVVTEEWEGYTNENGDGVYWEVIDAVFNKLGILYERSLVPWARAEKEIRSGTADIIVGAYYSQGQGIVFPKWHLSVEEDLMAVIHKTDKNTWQSKLNTKPVVWIRGYGFEKHFAKNILFKEVNSTKQGLKLISVNRGLAHIDYLSAITPALKNIDVDSQNLSTVKFRDGTKIYVGFSEAGGALHYISAFDEVMEKFVKDGTIERIYKRWNIDPKKFGKDRYGK